MDIILTGIARSGTTLACHLLNRLPQCVALHEPMDPSHLTQAGPQGFLQTVNTFFSDQRGTLLSSGKAVSKAHTGAVPDNPFGPSTDGNCLRATMVTNQEIHFDKKLREDFRLVVKHPNAFTANLGALVEAFTCVALVRNPLAVLLSWHSIQAPVQQGRIPMGEAFDENLRHSLAAEADLLERQILILRWYFARYDSHLPSANVIKYEEVIASRGQALSVIDPDAATLTSALKNANTNSLYDAGLVDRLADRLQEDDSVYGAFYSKEDIEELRHLWRERLAQMDNRISSRQEAAHDLTVRGKRLLRHRARSSELRLSS